MEVMREIVKETALQTPGQRRRRGQNYSRAVPAKTEIPLKLVENHTMVMVGRDLKGYLVLTPLLWARTHTTPFSTPGCSGLHPAWP